MDLATYDEDQLQRFGQTVRALEEIVENMEARFDQLTKLAPHVHASDLADVLHVFDEAAHLHCRETTIEFVGCPKALYIAEDFRYRVLKQVYYNFDLFPVQVTDTIFPEITPRTDTNGDQRCYRIYCYAIDVLQKITLDMEMTEINLSAYKAYIHILKAHAFLTSRGGGIGGMLPAKTYGLAFPPSQIVHALYQVVFETAEKYTTGDLGSTQLSPTIPLGSLRLAGNCLHEDSEIKMAARISKLIATIVSYSRAATVFGYDTSRLSSLDGDPNEARIVYTTRQFYSMLFQQAKQLFMVS